MGNEERQIAIQVQNLNKRYKLYDHNRDRVIDALGFSKRAHYREHMALEDVSMTIYRGETVGIIGTNGSGKSTILKIITGVLTQTSGEVSVNGRISALLELGAGFNMEYNGIDNIYLNGTMIGFSEQEIKDKIDAILDFADIGEYIYQPVKTYSSGMFMRLAFAVAINIEPEILIVDEALSVGDVFFQAKCYHKFEEFKKMGKTVLFVSHDLSSVSKYCDRVVLLNQGHKLGEGSAKDMIDIYKQVLVGQYDPKPDTSGAANLLADGEVQAAAAKRSDEAQAKVHGAVQAAPVDPTSENARLASGLSEDSIADAGADTADITNRGAAAEPGAAKMAGRAGSAGGEGVPERNPDTLEYGSQKAVITGYSVTDNQGKASTTILKGTECTVHMSVRFLENIAAPIFAFTIRNIYGVELCGTNTMFEKAFLEPVRAGEEKRISFTQRIDLQGGEYLISLGVTGYEQENFTVYHRLYDVMNLTVVSDKNTVGYYDVNSRITVE
ncbi:MAG: Wzt carbohydrate-binding domain-containing protein [Eubacteriales bacterium]|nr:Wzt carbohydrate-binding domain-containing protein [Eubacteriales bacterium]